MIKVKRMKPEDYGKTEATIVSCCGPGIGLPLLLITIGIWLVGRDLGWWKQSINLWGVLLVALGAYWLLQRIFIRKL